ncbi:TrmH family RNA methyltransferase [Marinobacterium sediminicola]|uniref:RNA methyltransferase, TrmH family n=1 Tax=Marinobacterium sediminicola TaxID=518898 RepID=A0ABY1RWD0_9GAMM|nr:RNA methyltransferase [Marinobacterium sediminicola]ULG70365.1 RNA methyltransferase [Marinobacterium sediminicola]SMR69605.1 RNA methyltransferase, TrmH family [Marinobacterium sediminicola]
MKLDLIKKLQQKKYRTETGCCLVEGEHLVLELQKAAASQPSLKAAELYLTEQYANWQTELKVHEVTGKQMSAISATKSPQGIVAVLPMGAIRTESARDEVALYLHEIQDPGNLGTILRTLAWFGGYRCLLSPGSVDPFNPKVIRASMGAIFHVPLELDVPLESLGERFSRIGCLDMEGEPLSADAFKACDCYLFGNEARGVPRDQLDRLNARAFTIPGVGLIESLNLGTAVSLSVYERQR